MTLKKAFLVFQKFNFKHPIHLLGCYFYIFAHDNYMSYFNYHATAKKLIKDGKLTDFYITEKYGNISPALILIFNDEKHPIMPIRQHKWSEYFALLNVN